MPESISPSKSITVNPQKLVMHLAGTSVEDEPINEAHSSLSILGMRSGSSHLAIESRHDAVASITRASN